MSARPISGLRPLNFTSHSSLSLFGDGVDRPEGPNIGLHGEHLTIVFLAHSRVELSEKLCRSIAEQLPDFKGEILAVDNGSSAAEAKQLAEFLRDLPVRSRILTLDKNYGVSVGRNRGVEAVKTSWVMSLDNDMYFVRNPLPTIQRDIGLLAAKFVNLPLLTEKQHEFEAFGGTLSLWLSTSGDLRVGHGSSYLRSPAEPTERSPELSTFLFGGASIFDKEAFLRLGGFDEAMFVGFEDTDLSIRLLREGMKVGTVGSLSLVHDHPSPNAESSSYKRVRFSYTEIENSARYMEAKYGFSFWNDDLKEWLLSKDSDLALTATSRRERDQRPRVALVVDSADWAFANISRQLMEHLADQFDFTMIVYSQIGDDLRMLLATKEFDLVHFFWREHLLNLRSPNATAKAQQLGLDLEALLMKHRRQTAITFGVYDHLFLSPEDIARYRWIFEEADGYAVSSKRLDAAYRSIAGFPSPSAQTSDGVDPRLFAVPDTDRSDQSPARPLRVGWAGNSKWGIGSKASENKGLHSVLRPAIALVREQGIEIQEDFADLADKQRSLEEMPDYYRGIDVYVCVSQTEGTPNPLLEAMACGVPVVSTDVGIVPELFGPRQREFVVERTAKAVADALIRLHNDRRLLASLAQENLNAIRPWHWDLKVQEYGRFFTKVISGRVVV